MTIEFRCSQCNQLLRVPDTSAGKNARCPKCQALMQVPSGAGFAAPPPPLPSGAGGMPTFGPSAPPPPAAGNDPFSFLGAGGGAGSAPPPPQNPFGGSASANPFGGGHGAPSGAAVNPYASPLGTVVQPKPSYLPGQPINPQVVPLEPVFNYAWRVWQTNLGILVGVTVIIMAISMAFSFVMQGIQGVLSQNDQPEAALAVYGLGQLIGNAIQVFLGIGNITICLKLARQQPADFGDLFSGGRQFIWVFLAYIFYTIVVTVGLFLLIVPGVLLALMLWPYFYILTEEKAGLVDSFPLAARITQGNWGTVFVLALLSVCITLVGCAALCIGILFAAPLISMIFAVAYLMMSGQIPVQYGYTGR